MFKLVNPSADQAMSHSVAVAAGAANTISRGEPTKLSAGAGVVIMADGEGTTSELFTGIAKSESTDTASAAGRVDVWVPFPGIIYSGKPKVSGSCDTQAKLDALYGKRVVFDLTNSVWTVDTAASDGIGNAVVLCGGQRDEDIVYFFVTHSICNFFENN